jgi:hypothetical protein
MTSKSGIEKRRRVQVGKNGGKYYISKSGRKVYVKDSYLPPSLKKKVNSLKKNAGKARGSSTRGWSAKKPYTLSQKKEIQSKCGLKCFLDPKKLGFPVCAKCENGNCPCQFDKQGKLSNLEF